MNAPRPDKVFETCQVWLITFACARQLDTAYCGGALRGFPDTVGSLREIGRALKPGAPLVVLTSSTAREVGRYLILALRKAANVVGYRV